MWNVATVAVPNLAIACGQAPHKRHDTKQGEDLETIGYCCSFIEVVTEPCFLCLGPAATDQQSLCRAATNMLHEPTAMARC